jgi:hypothetical protein
MLIKQLADGTRMVQAWTCAREGVPGMMVYTREIATAKRAEGFHVAPVVIVRETDGTRRYLPDASFVEMSGTPGAEGPWFVVQEGELFVVVSDSDGFPEDSACWTTAGVAQYRADYLNDGGSVDHVTWYSAISGDAVPFDDLADVEPDDGARFEGTDHGPLL